MVTFIIRNGFVSLFPQKSNQDFTLQDKKAVVLGRILSKAQTDRKCLYWGYFLRFLVKNCPIFWSNVGNLITLSFPNISRAIFKIFPESFEANKNFP